MGKLLVLVGVLAIALWWLWGRRPAKPPNPGEKAGNATKASSPDVRLPQNITACAHCGVHVPEGEALKDDAGRTYCNDSHRRLGPPT